MKIVKSDIAYLSLMGALLGIFPSAQASSTMGLGGIAEKELQVAPASQDRIIMGSSSVLIRDLGNENSATDLNWSLSLQLTNFQPSGELRIVTGDRYNLSTVQAHPMLGAEICRNWARLGNSWRLANCVNASAATTTVELQTQSGYRLQNVRLTHLTSGLAFSLEKNFGNSDFAALTDLGAAYLIISQSSPNPTGTASSQNPFGSAGLSVRWSPVAKFFAKAGYQYWLPINSDSAPSSHWIASGGFQF